MYYPSDTAYCANTQFVEYYSVGERGDGEQMEWAIAQHDNYVWWMELCRRPYSAFLTTDFATQAHIKLLGWGCPEYPSGFG